MSDGGYTTGTVSITNNTTALVGVGTGWLTAGFQKGDKFYKGIAVGVIASVNSDTSITLAENWTGTTLATATYRLEFQPDLSRAHGDVRTLINLLGNGLLTAFAGLSGAVVDTIGYFNGTGTMVVTAFTAVGRAIVGAATGVAALDAVTGIGTTIPSATTLVLDSATADMVDISGTTTTTAITLGAGKERTVRAAAAWPITVGGTLILNNNGNSYTCAAGDIIRFRGYSGGVVRGVINPIDGASPAATTIGQALNSATSAGVAFDALSPTTTRGDIIVRTATTNARLALGTSGYLFGSNGTDATWLPFQSPSTGGVARTWNAKNADIVNVLDFGATGNGSTDDSVAIQAAMDALATTGGKLILPPKTFACHGLQWNGAPGVSLMLQGAGLATILLSNSATANLFSSVGGDVFVGDLTVEAPNATYQTAGAFFSFAGGRCCLENIRTFNGYDVAVWAGTSTNVVYGGGARHCAIFGNKHNGIVIDCAPSGHIGGQVSLQDLQMQGVAATTGNGVTLISGDAVIMSDLQVNGYFNNYSFVTSASRQYLANIFGTNCDADGAGGSTTAGDGWHLDGTLNFLGRVLLTNCWAGAMLGNGVIAKGVYGFQWNCGMVIDNVGCGIYINGACEDVSVVGGTVTGNANATVGFGAPGILVDGTVTGLRIQAVRSGPTQNGTSHGTTVDKQGTGININSTGVTKYFILDNDLRGNSSGLNDGGTGTAGSTKFVANNMTGSYP